MPFVSFGRANDDWDFLWVDTDGEEGTRQAVEYLVSLGHRKIAMAAWQEDVADRELWRVAGYLRWAALRGNRASRIFCAARTANRPGATRCKRWWELPAEERPTAIIAISDLIAIGIMNEAEQRGLTVGKDLSVIGFDDAPMTQYLRPALTTLRQPIEQIGEVLITMLEDAIEGVEPEVRHLLLPPRLIKRASCGPVVELAPHPG